MCLWPNYLPPKESWVSYKETQTIKIMKAIITLTIVLFFGAISHAQSKDLPRQSLKKKESFKVITIKMVSLHKNAIKPISLEYAYLSKFKNTRVKKALRFSPQNKKTKIA